METERRKPRADGLRNRERLIEAAKAFLGQGGPGSSLEAMARQAEVGCERQVLRLLDIFIDGLRIR